MGNPGVDQNFTDLAAVVQLRLRVAFGLQALQRCSGLLNRSARGSTVAARQPSLAAQQERGCHAEASRRRAYPSVRPSFGSASHFRIRGEINYHPPLRTGSLQVGVLPDAPISMCAVSGSKCQVGLYGGFP